jgi:hypothetical protein
MQLQDYIAEMLWTSSWPYESKCCDGLLLVRCSQHSTWQHFAHIVLLRFCTEIYISVTCYSLQAYHEMTGLTMKSRCVENVLNKLRSTTTFIHNGKQNCILRTIWQDYMTCCTNRLKQFISVKNETINYHLHMHTHSLWNVYAIPVPAW